MDTQDTGIAQLGVCRGGGVLEMAKGRNHPRGEKRLEGFWTAFCKGPREGRRRASKIELGSARVRGEIVPENK